MDRLVVSRSSDSVSYPTGFIVDLHNQILIFHGGFTVPIIDMLDQYGEETDEIDEVVILVAAMPPEGVVVTIDLRRLRQDEAAPVTH